MWVREDGFIIISTMVFEQQKLGFIKQVDKGWITTVEDL